VALNGLANVRPVHAAVGDRTGVAHISNGPRFEANTVVRTEDGLSVPLRTLDDVLKEHGIEQIDLLKMNIEGAELSALHGMPRLLRHVRQAVIACHDFLAETPGGPPPTKTAVRRLLVQAGFEVQGRVDERPYVADFLYAVRRDQTPLPGQPHPDRQPDDGH